MKTNTMMNKQLTFALQICLLLFGLLSATNCKKEEEKPLALRRHLLGAWYADVVTQSGIDVTANYQYSFDFKPDSTTIGQRKVLGTPTQYVGTWRVDEETDDLYASYTGWDLHWQLIEADTSAQVMRFKDLDASAETIIELWRF